MAFYQLESSEIDIASYQRRQQYEFFKDLFNPYTGLTAPIEITSFLKAVRDNGLPFFLSLLYAAAQAAEAVPDLRRRIVNGHLIEFRHCYFSFTLAKEDGSFVFCPVYAALPFERYLKEAQAAEAESLSKDSMSDEKEIKDSLIFVSSVPWVSYTGHTMATPYPADSNPRLTWGKYYSDKGRVFLPVTLLVNHAVADGRDIADFFRAMEEKLGLFDPRKEKAGI